MSPLVLSFMGPLLFLTTSGSISPPPEQTFEDTYNESLVSTIQLTVFILILPVLFPDVLRGSVGGHRKRPFPFLRTDVWPKL